MRVTALASAALAFATLLPVASAEATPRPIPVGEPMVFFSNQLVGIMKVGPATANLQILLPAAVDTVTFPDAKWSFTANGNDGPWATGVVPVSSAMTIPWSLPPVGVNDDGFVGNTWPGLEIEMTGRHRDTIDYVRELTPMADGYQLGFMIRWDASLTSSTTVADLRVPEATPGEEISVDFGFFDKLTKPIAVKRGQSLTFTAKQPGFFTQGPWGVPFRYRLTAGYGWLDPCLPGSARMLVSRTLAPRGCGGGPEMTSIPVKVSADGRSATVTFPYDLIPPSKHRPAEIVKLQLLPVPRFIKEQGGGLSPNPGAPGELTFAREVALK